MRAYGGMRAAAMAGTLLMAGMSCSGSGQDDGHTVQVFAAASLGDAFTEIGRGFEHAHQDVRVRLNLAGSQQLALQIDQGAPADVFASADERWMDHVRARDLLEGGSAVFAHNRLIVIVRARGAARFETLGDLARPGVRLVLGSDEVPVGRYARTMLRNLARDPAYGAGFATRVLANVASEEENVKSVVAKVQLGEADAGIVYRSDVTPDVARQVRVLDIPDWANVLADYPIALLRHAPDTDAGRAFIAFVRSDEGQRILERNGLDPAPGTGR